MHENNLGPELIPAGARCVGFAQIKINLIALVIQSEFNCSCEDSTRTIKEEPALSTGPQLSRS